ncbi:MAG: inner membrane protein YpjD [Acidiferrobacterales bacterium]
MSTVTAASVLAIGLYLAATGLLVTPWFRLEQQEVSAGFRWPAGTLMLLGLIAHSFALRQAIVLDSVLNLSIISVGSLTSWAAVFMLFLASLARPLQNLGIAVLPVAALTILLGWLMPGEPVLSRPMTTPQSLHIIVSLLAYSLIFLATIQSILLLLQEKHLRQHQPGGFIRALPPMETMEYLMFWLIYVGLGLLTLTVISGVFFSETLFGKPLKFTHHTVLSIASWVIFSILVAGHWWFGWRGRTAVRWTLIGFLLLILAYFGSKFVFEVLR